MFVSLPLLVSFAGPAASLIFSVSIGLSQFVWNYPLICLSLTFFSGLCDIEMLCEGEGEKKRERERQVDRETGRERRTERDTQSSQCVTLGLYASQNLQTAA